MKSSRRHCLALLSAASWAQTNHSAHHAIPFEASTGPAPHARRDIAAMKADDPQLEMFRAAVREMKRRSAANKLDPLGWYQNAVLHAMFCATNDFDLQVHYCNYFLPWHRAYLAFLERKMRAVISEPSLCLPYWDWTATPRIPEHFFGDRNPLWDSTRLQSPSSHLPADFIDVGPVLRAPTFRVFAGFPKRGASDPQVEGILEQGAHNNTHNWIGGNMAGFPSAGFDPMFGTHHGNVDRLWEAWLRQGSKRQNSTDPAWLDYAFYFHDESGRMVRIPIRDILNTESLGYRYDSLDFTSIAPASKKADKSKRSYVHIRFPRNQVPAHPYCARVFIAAKGQDIAYEAWSPEYAGTVTLLPVADHNSGYLDEWVSMILEIGAEQAELIRTPASSQLVMAPVSLRGRQTPFTPLKVQQASLEILPDA